MAGQGAAEAVHWFELPEEVWEVILENLEGSNDILNVLNVFPHLQGQVMKNTWEWRMDHVLFLLLPWLDHNNILALRQVSKRWLRGVDNLIQNHPDRRPYQSGGMEVAHLNPYWLLLEDSPAYSRIANHFAPRHCLSQLIHFDSVGRIMDQHHPQTNRAITRRICIDADCWLRDTHQLQEVFWNRAEEFIHKFGDHICHLEIIWREKEYGPIALDRLSTVLGSVPQLKTLVLETSKMSIDEESQPFQLDRPLPELPELETLKIDVAFYQANVCNFVVQCYAKQIRRLDIDVVFWKVEYAEMFLQLMELTLLSNDKFTRPNEALLVTVLSSLNAPKLCWLELKRELWMSVFLKEVIPCLVRFPHLRKLVVSLYKPPMKSSEIPTMFQEDVVILPSIKCLQILETLSDSGWRVLKRQRLLWLDFLVSFPNLEYLGLEVIAKKRFENKNKKIYSLEAWEALRNLKEITQLQSGYSSRSLRFRHTRAKYDFLKEEEATGLEKIFRSFASMISGDWGVGVPTQEGVGA